MGTGERSEAYQRGWEACLAGRTLTLGLGCDIQFADGYLACMQANLSGSLVCAYPTSDEEE